MSVQPSSARTVGDYQLLTKLGEGGMGVVYLARRPGETRVALKVLRPHIVGDDEARARLAREVSSLSRIRSRWVAEIVDADPWAPVPYIATRYVPGLSLHDHVPEEGPIQGVDLRWFARCLADAVAGVHAVGVVHRDVKPSNVLLEGRTPILIDFGLARVADDPKLTHTGWFLGTPGYLAPEILHGESATTASDVHSWAATVAFAGAGSPPFGRGPSMAIMDRVRRGEHDLGGLPDDLRPIVAAALQPDPGRRPRLSDIRGWLADDAAPSTAAPASAAPPAEDPFTLPLAIASHDRAEAETWAPDHSAPVGPATYDEWSPPPPERPTRLFPTEDPDDLPVDLAPLPARDRTAVLLRRCVLIAALGALGAAAVSAWPYLGLVAVLSASWLLRACSMIATARSDRRRLRGARWYDVLLAPLSAPWYLVASIPGTLLLGLWALGLGAAGALLAYAIGAGTTALLFAAGLCVVVSLWFGPGSAHVRWPVRVAAQALARSTFVWLVATVLVLIAAGMVAQLATQQVTWSPFGNPSHIGSALPRV